QPKSATHTEPLDLDRPSPRRIAAYYWKLRLKFDELSPGPDHQQRKQQSDEGSLHRQCEMRRPHGEPRLGRRIDHFGATGWPGLHCAQLLDLASQKRIRFVVDIDVALEPRVLLLQPR